MLAAQKIFRLKSAPPLWRAMAQTLFSAAGAPFPDVQRITRINPSFPHRHLTALEVCLRQRVCVRDGVVAVVVAFSLPPAEASEVHGVVN